ncbi:hypothetical protein ACTMTF_47730 [Nonomuraea sp. ZG12]|uniref:hypothetical protein n=1 Tax=Nonomuraea sp. ZG12 TaxID=3452207 RepID=UPI003F8B9608
MLVLLILLPEIAPGLVPVLAERSLLSVVGLVLLAGATAGTLIGWLNNPSALLPPTLMWGPRVARTAGQDQP